MTHQWNDESQKPQLFSPSKEQRKDETIWTKMAYNGLQMSTFHLCGHPKCSRIGFQKQFLTHL